MRYDFEIIVKKKKKTLNKLKFINLPLYIYKENADAVRLAFHDIKVL